MDETPTYLSPEDLGEFRMRRGAVEQAAIASSMIQVGFKQWANEIRTKYLLEGPFDVDIQTGEIAMRPETANG